MKFDIWLGSYIRGEAPAKFEIFILLDNKKNKMVKE